MDTKALRQKILDLAIHGKLVPQYPNDEPANELLQRIREEKERLIKEGKIKKGKKSAKTSDTGHYENVPFDVPSSWEWTTIGDVCSKIGSGSTPKGSNYAQSGIPFFRSQNVYNQGLVFDDIKYISLDIHQSMIGTEVLANDLLLNITGGSLGRCAVVPSNFKIGNVSQHVCIIRGIIVNPHYLQAFVLSSLFAKTMKITGSGREGLPKYNLERMRFPLPPLAEQHRIVAEIERWFSLIDIIERGKASLQVSVKQAKSKILDLAIHGKLVPQDSADEPACELLRRINPKAEIASDNAHYGKMPFDVPSSWEWTTLGEISDYGKSVNVAVDDIGDNEWVLELEDIEKDTANIIQHFIKSERQINGTRHRFRKGDVLYSKLRTYLNKVLVAPDDGYCTTEIMAFSTYGSLSNDYICHVLRSQYFLDYTLQCGYGVKMPRLSTSDACKGFIPIPPLPEQHRIVSKLEELFAQLDRIEAEL